MSTVYIVAILIALIYYSIRKKELYIKQLKLDKIQWCAIVFLIINVISSFASPYFSKYNIFIGVGRGEGLIAITLYCLTFLCITFFGEFKKRYILYFSISALLQSMICILQYIGFNPLNMYQDGIGTHNVSFMGTIGNKDFLSAFFCIVLIVTLSDYILSDNKKYIQAINLSTIFMGFFILGILSVLSGGVGILATILLIAPYIITSSKKLSRALIAGSMILLGYATNIIINPTYYYSLGALKFNIQFNVISFFLIMIAVLLIGLAMMLKKRNFDLSVNAKVIKIMYIVMISFVLLVVLILYCIDFNYGILHEVHQIMHGNLDDDFGTYRIFLWKRAISLMGEAPIIGTGPDTFAIRFMDKYTEDIAKLGEITINDTAANVYLTMAVNIGILGLLAYLLFIGMQIFKGIKYKNKYSTIFLIAIICYIIQDFFNLWVVNVTPIFWTLMAIHYISLKDELSERKE